MEAESQLENAWEQAKNGNDTDGRIDLGNAYISYETETINDSRFFKVWIGLENESVGATPPEPVRSAYDTVLSVIPEVDLLPESGEMYGSIEL